MKKKFYETESFKSDQAKWYKKLEQSGFHDIETQSDKKLGVVSPQLITVDHNRVTYFERCKAFLHSGQIKDALDRFIFEKHCEGRSNREISLILAKSGFKALSSRGVDNRLNKLLDQAGIKPITMNF